MSVIGIVAEWNPFHNGHQHLVNRIRADHPEACIASVMSGSFCQRGEVACFDKWTRAEMALAAGVDVVLELPQVYATASLEGFAQGGVASLLAFAPLDALYCGSESGDNALLHAQAQHLQAHRTEYDAYIQAAAAAGTSYTEASQRFLEAAGLACGKDSPNDRLALHYRLALPAEIPMHLITRTVSHHADAGAGGMMSGSAIRKHLPHEVDAVRAYMPPTSIRLMQRAFDGGWQMAEAAPLLTTLKVLACGLDAPDIAARLHIRDGWEHRFLDAIHSAADFEDLLTRAQTRHYSRSRVRRLILQLLCPLPPAPTTPGYCRILGFSNRGRALLRNRPNEVPCVLNTAKDARTLTDEAQVLLQGDIHRQNLADRLCMQPHHQRDYLERPRLIASTDTL